MSPRLRPRGSPPFRCSLSPCSSPIRSQSKARTILQGQGLFTNARSTLGAWLYTQREPITRHIAPRGPGVALYLNVDFLGVQSTVGRANSDGGVAVTYDLLQGTSERRKTTSLSPGKGNPEKHSPVQSSRSPNRGNHVHVCQELSDGEPFTKQHEKQSESTNRVWHLKDFRQISRTRDQITQNSQKCPFGPGSSSP